MFSAWHHQMDTFFALLSLVWGIHRLPVNSPRKGRWREVLMFFLIFARIKVWVKNHEAGDLTRHRAHYDVIVMITKMWVLIVNAKHKRTHILFKIKFTISIWYYLDATIIATKREPMQCIFHTQTIYTCIMPIEKNSRAYRDPFVHLVKITLWLTETNVIMSFHWYNCLMPAVYSQN